MQPARGSCRATRRAGTRPSRRWPSIACSASSPSSCSARAGHVCLACTCSRPTRAALLVVGDRWRRPPRRACCGSTDSCPPAPGDAGARADGRHRGGGRRGRWRTTAPGHGSWPASWRCRSPSSSCASCRRTSSGWASGLTVPFRYYLAFMPVGLLMLLLPHLGERIRPAAGSHRLAAASARRARRAVVRARRRSSSCRAWRPICRVPGFTSPGTGRSERSLRVDASPVPSPSRPAASPPSRPVSVVTSTEIL